MKHTDYIMAMMNNLQAINLSEKGISFVEEAFTELYEQVGEALTIDDYYLNDHIMDVNTAKVKGILMGAIGTGVGVGLYKVGKKIKKNRKSEKIIKED